MIDLGVESKARGELGEYDVMEPKWTKYFRIERMLSLGKVSQES